CRGIDPSQDRSRCPDVRARRPASRLRVLEAQGLPCARAPGSAREAWRLARASPLLRAGAGRAGIAAAAAVVGSEGRIARPRGQIALVLRVDATWHIAPDARVSDRRRCRNEA